MPLSWIGIFAFAASDRQNRLCDSTVMGLVGWGNQPQKISCLCAGLLINDQSIKLIMSCKPHIFCSFTFCCTLGQHSWLLWFMFCSMNTSSGNPSQGNLLSKILWHLHVKSGRLCRIEHKLLLGVLNSFFREIKKTLIAIVNRLKKQNI